VVKENLGKTEALRKGKERHSGKESATFTGSRPLFGKKDLSGVLAIRVAL
jgi:hypothetical protein